MIFTLLLFMLLSRAAIAFHCTSPHYHRPLARKWSKDRTSQLDLASDDANADAKVTVKATELDDSLGLTSEERTVVNVHRVCKDSVVYVTSVLKSSTDSGSGGSRSRRGWSRRRNKAKTPQQDGDESNGEQEHKLQKLPRGTALGSGSGFVMDSEGYIVTNYHVIQRAYETNQAVIQYETFWDGLAKNATDRVKDSVTPLNADSNAMDNLESFINTTVGAISGRDAMGGVSSSNLPAQVFVRFGTNGDGNSTGQSSSTASYHLCEIVDVVKELDVAVLKLSNPLPSLKALPYGSSSNLLVGQSLVAIGNPFGLDRTLSSGVVSALGRSITGVAGNDIKNCIQTDAAINPGNSGGPLLNLNGEVVGVNTMIITTSGSSAGIGFAVPGDNVKENAEGIVELDRERRLRSAKRKGRGWLGADVATASSLEDSFRKRLSAKATSSEEDGVFGAFLTSIAVESPLSNSSIATTSITNGNINLGDRIVNVGGNPIANGQEFVSEMKKRVEGEQLTLTVENVEGEKRVVYVTLGRIPL
eukprot:CAMPEP_0183731376 /NCGR_PEP_ID=MMETSP0737-20130205/35244_1 /TAXON_ID=385413 /ORGANISM="Thalassiosira miniscula, Strain CCMP1093" /LENGTH=530 /DNA_ID=CAMNT_0025964089 /DNA_START=371 /DNA_END=1963 /DNA_ORIENTATION=-